LRNTSHQKLQSTQIDDQLALAKAAATGDKKARQKVNGLAHPLIDYQTSRFCKRFCSENQYLYRCTLKPPMGALRKDVAWCEWANASYGWMLNDLSHEKRLLKYQANNGAKLFDYLYQIANSQPFYERWKDWRFARKVHVPTYIRALAPQAAKVFYGLRNGENLELIAQKLSRSVDEVKVLVHQIMSLLTQKKRLYLLDPPKQVSMTAAHGDIDDEQDERQLELATNDVSIEQQIEQHEVGQRLQRVWLKLDVAEQFVLQALLIEEQDAQDVLSALQQMDVSIKTGVSAADTNRQQLYYFRRKTLEKLAALMRD
jgi:hypothetical protein